MQIRTEKVIDVSDWDELVVSTYGRPYNFQQQDGCKDRGYVPIEVPSEDWEYENSTVTEEVNGPEEGVSFSAWLARDPKTPLNTEEGERDDYGLELWWDRNFYPHINAVIGDLYEKGLLPEGEYKIAIDW